MSQSFQYSTETIFWTVLVTMNLITEIHDHSPIFWCIFGISNFFCKMVNMNEFCQKTLKIKKLTNDPVEGIGCWKEPHFLSKAKHNHNLESKDEVGRIKGTKTQQRQRFFLDLGKNSLVTSIFLFNVLMDRNHTEEVS